MKTVLAPAVAAQDYRKRLLKTHSQGNRTAKVYHDPDWGEHLVRFFEDGVENKEATYHTDDKQDAMDTAEHFVKRAGVSKEGAATAADEGDSVEVWLVGQADEACGIVCAVLRQQHWGAKIGVGLFRGDTINVSLMDDYGHEVHQTDEGYNGEVVSKVRDYLVGLGIQANEDTDSGVLVVGVSTGSMYFESPESDPTKGAEEGDRVKILDQRWKDQEGTLVKYNGPGKPSVISLEDGETVETTEWYNLEDGESSE